MRRSILLTTSALGLLICLLGSAGLFAALTDTADTDINHVDTAPLAGSADLQLAPINGANGCGTWADDLTTGLVSATDVALPGTAPSVGFCIRNIGSQSVSTAVTVIDLTDTEKGACTGDEQDYLDVTCGAGAAGELSPIIDVEFFVTDCAGNLGGPTFASGLTDLVSTPLAIVSLASGNTTCYLTQVDAGSGASATQLQVAQSDAAEWRFRFTGTATP
jgi:hypothetical protein